MWITRVIHCDDYGNGRTTEHITPIVFQERQIRGELVDEQIRIEVRVMLAHVKFLHAITPQHLIFVSKKRLVPTLHIII